MNPQTALMANANRLIKIYVDMLYVFLCLIKLKNCNYIVFGCHKKYNYYLMIIVLRNLLTVNGYLLFSFCKFVAKEY